jgi:heavy metal sensor kinase
MFGWTRSSIRIRLAALFTLAIFLVLLPFAGVLYLFVRVQLRGAMDRLLQGESEEAVLVMTEAAQRSSASPEILAAALSDLERIEDVRYQLWTASGELIHQRLMPEDVRRSLPTDIRAGSPSSIRLPDGRYFRVLTTTFRIGSRDFTFRTVMSEDEVRSTLARLFGIELAGLLGALLAAALAGFLLARRALAPVRVITERARLLTADKLEEGIPVVHPRDELGQLARTFNELFQRLDSSFKRLRQFTADASHELRTPLTAIRTVAEVGLERQTVDSQRQAIESILEEAQRTTRILDSLLMLARADARDLELSRVPVDLDELSRNTVEQLAVLAEEKSQELQLDTNGPVIVRADPVYLRQALMNIVDNAIKYSPASRPIRITVRRHGAEGTVAVSDQGPGIAHDEQVRVFERFYRVDRARSRSLGGSGLGLSIARWAVEACGGSIELASRPGKGSTFRIVLPLATPAP